MAKPRPGPNMNAPNAQTPGARMWLYGYDAIKEVRSRCDPILEDTG